MPSVLQPYVELLHERQLRIPCSQRVVTMPVHTVSHLFLGTVALPFWSEPLSATRVVQFLAGPLD